MLTILELLEVGDTFLETVPELLSVLALDSVSDSLYLLTLLELLAEVREKDLVMEAALVYLDVAEGLTLFGLTHSAWWERSLEEGMGWSQNSQGSITVSGSGSGLLAVGLAWAELTIEELVDLVMEEDLREVKFLLEYISSVLEKLALCDALENEDSATLPVLVWDK